MTTVFVVAETGIARVRLEALVAGRGTLGVISRANDRSLLHEIAATRPDVLLLDLHEQRVSQILRGLARGASRRPGIVVLTAGEAAPAWTAQALRAGVRAVLPRAAAADEIILAIEAVAAGLIVFHPDRVEALSMVQSHRERLDRVVREPLTARETEVLTMLAEGLGNKRIAARLGISGHTVKFHVASVLGKLNATSRTEAVTIGVRAGLIMI